MTADTLRRLRRAGAAIGLAVVLGAIAAAASPLRLPDSYYYERIAARTIIPGCAEIHCFRPLVPWTLGLLPPAVAKWKAYAVLCNVGAAMAVFDLCLIVGMTARASILAASLSAFGFGSLYTLFEPFTSDPLMFWVAPLTTRWLLQDRVARAGALTCLGVFAKEFVVAPIVIVVLADARAGRWARARRAAAAAAIAFSFWLALQYGFMHAFGYSYGDNKSPKLSSGGYLVFWLQHESLRASMAAMFVEFGALYPAHPVRLSEGAASAEGACDRRDSGRLHLRVRSAARPRLVELSFPDEPPVGPRAGRFAESARDRICAVVRTRQSAHRRPGEFRARGQVRAGPDRRSSPSSPSSLIGASES